MTRQGISCSPTLPEPELTPLRYLDPETGTTHSPADPESAQDPWLQEDPWSRRSGAEISASSTESKKHCSEDLCEQTDRSATSAGVAVRAPCKYDDTSGSRVATVTRGKCDGGCDQWCISAKT